MRWRLLPIVTFAVALATAAVLTVVPAYSGESCATTAGGTAVCTSSSETLVEHEGATVLLVLLVPAAIAALGVARPTRMVLQGLAIALTVCVVLGAASIGMFYVPTAVAAFVAALRSPGARQVRLDHA